MSYYWFNKKELLQKVKEKYDNCGNKEKTAEYYKTTKSSSAAVRVVLKMTEV